MKIALFAELAVLVVLFLLSRGRYDEFIKPLDKKKHPFKQLLPITLYLLDIVRFDSSAKYNSRLIFKIAELYGYKYSQYYLRIHWASRILYSLFGVVTASFLSLMTKPDAVFSVFSVLLIAGFTYLADNGLNNRLKKRRSEIKMDFPDFLNKLILLINAGMTVSRAFEKISAENKKEGALYYELEMALMEIKSGKPEQKAYEDFAKRCRTTEITRAVSVILQNLKKGSTELVSILRVHSNECWEMRKNTAKALGEEASTRMLLPMMLMFFAVLLIVAAPAVLAMRSF